MKAQSSSGLGGAAPAFGKRLDADQYNKDGLVDVWVSASVQQIYDIDTATQTFGFDAWINCLYRDPKLQKDPDKYRKGMYIAHEDAKELLAWDFYPVFHCVNNRGDMTVIVVLMCRRDRGRRSICLPISIT